MNATTKARYQYLIETAEYAKSCVMCAVANWQLESAMDDIIDILKELKETQGEDE